MYRSNRPSAYTQRRTQQLRSTLPRRGRRTIPLLLLSAALIVVVGGTILLVGRHKGTVRPTGTSTSNSNRTTGVPDGGFNRSAHATTDASSIWVVVNKQHPLNPKNYVPADLVVPNIPLRSNITSTEKYVRSDMAKALEKMVGDASSQGIHFDLQSGYRSYTFQVTLYNGYVQSQGQAVADRQSARPGYSEHQTGLAADLGGTSQPSCDVEACYADTVEGKWLAANAYKYGFIIRYKSDKEPVTGYLYEPWHIRYIGTELSTQLHNTGVETLEEFFNITGGTAY